ncbi:hypothetical protein HPB48_013828 [Haemaphysalis longicornis]|uniref:Uncharacterized protein n=1 Tax=Haemaphysalis longicornis TaxID=44386 RepID=A0A9J6FYU2_HAELO|nr:hypothetical protein HPB48_013828 [Haemaphysalis longicornis]
MLGTNSLQIQQRSLRLKKPLRGLHNSLQERALNTAKTIATTRPKKKWLFQKDISCSSEEETVAIAFGDSDSDMSGFDERCDTSE